MIAKIYSKCFSKGFKRRLLFVMLAGCVLSEICDCILVGSFTKWLKKKTISVIDLP